MLKIGQAVSWQHNGRTIQGVYWGMEYGQHCAKERASDWVLHFLNADSINPL